jgi:hypothetical protein
MLSRVFKPIDYKTYSNTVYYVFEPLIRYGLYVYIVTYFLPHKKNLKNTKKYKKRKYKNTRIHLFESLIRYLVFNHHYNFRFWADQVDIFG